MVAIPNPSTAAAGSKILASTWNADVRDADIYVVENLGGVGRRNAIINSHFDVWQRGTSFAVASSTKTYTADRWMTYRTATGCTVSRQAGGPSDQWYTMRVQRDSGNTSTQPIYAIHPIETLDSRKFAGRNAYLKLTMKAGIDFSAASSAVLVRVQTGTGTNETPEVAWTGAADALSTSQVITTSYVDYDFGPIAISYGATQIKVSVTFTPSGTASTNDWFEIAAAQLSVDPAPDFERLPYAETLALCQRYYQTGVGYWYGQATSGVTHGYTLALPVAMRATPNVSFTNVSNTSFGATSGSSAINSGALLIARVATATAGGIFQESWTAEKEL